MLSSKWFLENHHFFLQFLALTFYQGSKAKYKAGKFFEWQFKNIKLPIKKSIKKIRLEALKNMSICLEKNHNKSQFRQNWLMNQLTQKKFRSIVLESLFR